MYVSLNPSLSEEDMDLVEQYICAVRSLRTMRTIVAGLEKQRDDLIGRIRGYDADINGMRKRLDVIEEHFNPSRPEVAHDEPAWPVMEYVKD